MIKNLYYGCCHEYDAVCDAYCDLPVKHFTVNIGDKIYYEGTVHCSVGIGFYVTVDDDYLKATSSSRYTNPGMAHELDGADKEEVTCCFEAIEMGETEIIINNTFRGSEEGMMVVRLEICCPNLNGDKEWILQDNGTIVEKRVDDCRFVR